MKLYATVTSERATKGQGGNEYISIKLEGINKKYLGNLTLIIQEGQYELLLDNYTDIIFIGFPQGEGITKAKSQKGEDRCWLCSENPETCKHQGTLHSSEL